MIRVKYLLITEFFIAPLNSVPRPMRLSSPDPNTSVAWGLKSSQALGTCVVSGRTSMFSFSRVQVNMKMEGQFMVPGGATSPGMPCPKPTRKAWGSHGPGTD